MSEGVVSEVTEEVSSTETSENISTDLWDISDEDLMNNWDGSIEVKGVSEEQDPIEEYPEEDTEEVVEESEGEEEVIPEGEVTDPEEFNYETAYKELLGDYTPEQVKQLMDMGTKFNPEMDRMKPAMKVMKMLENANLLDEGKLNHLIDISQKKPEAIAAWIKESGIDVHDLDLDVEYKAQNHSVSDEQVVLDGVIESIAATEHGKRTLNIITQEWDNGSRELLAKHPQVMTMINNHVGDGTFDSVMKEVSKRRMFGEFAGMPTVLAYQQVGQEMMSKPTPAQRIQSPKPQPKVDTQVAKKKAANVSPKSNQPVKTKEPDLYSLSDEELMKLIPM